MALQKVSKEYKLKSLSQLFFSSDCVRMVVINNGLFVYRESVCVREKEKERETETETETERKTEIDRETQIFFSIRAAMGSDVTYLLFGEKKKVKFATGKS